MITLLPDPDQQQVLDSITDVLSNQFSLDRFRDSAKAAGEAELSGWKGLAELGWMGLAAPEEVGGIGLSAVDETLMQRELGRSALSPTFLASCLAVHLAVQAGEGALAGKIVQGSQKVALAVPAGEPGTHVISAQRVDGDFHVIDRMDADLALILGPDGSALITLGDALSPVTGIDTTTSLHRVSAAGAAPHLFSPDPERQFLHHAWLLISANLVGMAEATRDLAVDYAKVREQFGKPIGTFQGVAHHCANMAARAEAAWVQTKFAALAVKDNRLDQALQVHSAYLLAAEAASQNAAIAVRIFGAMGFTAECAVHHYVKRSVLMKAAGGGVHLHASALVACEPA